MKIKKIILAVCYLAFVFSSCATSNNLLLGRVEATVGGHKVVVTDCYRTSVPPPEKIAGKGESSYRFRPCRDADILIRNEELIVNEKSYGLLKESDTITVDHGKVLINEEAAPVVAHK